MAERSAPEHAPAGRPAQGDLGRRIERRRTELGLTLEELAFRAGMAPSYLAHLERHSTAAPEAGTLLRLAGALRTDPAELGGGHVDLPPGLGHAARAPRLTELDEQECRRLLSTHGVGRIAVSTDAAPLVVPVNYSVVDDAVVFRTQPGTAALQGIGREVAFEVDRVDDALSQGWSVVVRGVAETVTGPDAVRSLAERAYSAPWAGGERDVWVRIGVTALTGRRIDVW
ncbi:pyridoxamine 5'-phosphate oxidase family protein [Streptomyces sp. NPDC006193]|uniref:helix-turn-helix domain-containing protein n=1 Tax=Streptomyces sp. NPDC006193 TaxID=3155717 RepID=UPI0033B6B8A6